MVRCYTATYDAEKTAQARALFSLADRLSGRLQEGGNGSRKPRVFPQVSLKFLSLRPQQLGPAGCRGEDSISPRLSNLMG